MTRRFGRMAALAATGVACAALTACGDSPPPADEMQYGTAQQMMAEQVQPTADEYWNAVRYESELIDGEVVNRDIKPETDEEWQALAATAVHLQDLGEVLKSPGYAASRGEDWMAFAQGMVDAAKLTEQAALDKDPDKVFEAGGTLYNVCSACHQAYPAESQPTEEGAEPAADAAA